MKKVTFTAHSKGAAVATGVYDQPETLAEYQKASNLSGTDFDKLVLSHLNASEAIDVGNCLRNGGDEGFKAWLGSRFNPNTVRARGGSTQTGSKAVDAQIAWVKANTSHPAVKAILPKLQELNAKLDIASAVKLMREVAKANMPKEVAVAK
jgi:hypothetical protein